MSTLLPTDDDNNPIPAMRLKPGGAQSIAATASSARNATGFDTAHGWSVFMPPGRSISVSAMRP